MRVARAPARYPYSYLFAPRGQHPSPPTAPNEAGEVSKRRIAMSEHALDFGQRCEGRERVVQNWENAQHCERHTDDCDDIFGRVAAVVGRVV